MLIDTVEENLKHYLVFENVQMLIILRKELPN